MLLREGGRGLAEKHEEARRIGEGGGGRAKKHEEARRIGGGEGGGQNSRNQKHVLLERSLGE